MMIRNWKIALVVVALMACNKKTEEAKPAERSRAALLDTKATETAPATFKAKFTTTKGDFVVEVHRDWAPAGVDRFFHLVKIGFYDDLAFFRVVKGFMVQFGIHGDPAVNAAWRDANIPDDPGGKQSNTRGMMTFATAGPNTRTTQLFINYANNVRLDAMGFTPFGQVVSGMDVVDAIEGQYGEGQPRGRGPAQDRLQSEGNAYLKAEYPALDYIKTAVIVP
jgi:peptidyl-prolyl cis-trans isomerase A (cyclophilin A)